MNKARYNYIHTIVNTLTANIKRLQIFRVELPSPSEKE